jgi:hypothetical protein
MSTSSNGSGSLDSARVLDLARAVERAAQALLVGPGTSFRSSRETENLRLMADLLRTETQLSEYLCTTTTTGDDLTETLAKIRGYVSQGKQLGEGQAVLHRLYGKGGAAIKASEIVGTELSLRLHALHTAAHDLLDGLQTDFGKPATQPKAREKAARDLWNKLFRAEINLENLLVAATGMNTSEWLQNIRGRVAPGIFPSGRELNEATYRRAISDSEKRLCELLMPGGAVHRAKHNFAAQYEYRQPSLLYRFVVPKGVQRHGVRRRI